MKTNSYIQISMCLTVIFIDIQIHTVTFKKRMSKRFIFFLAEHPSKGRQLFMLCKSTDSTRSRAEVFPILKLEKLIKFFISLYRFFE